MCICICVWEQSMCRWIQLPAQARRGYWLLWSWSYGQSTCLTCMLGSKVKSPARSMNTQPLKHLFGPAIFLVWLSSTLTMSPYKDGALLSLYSLLSPNASSQCWALGLFRCSSVSLVPFPHEPVFNDHLPWFFPFECWLQVSPRYLCDTTAEFSLAGHWSGYNVSPSMMRWIGGACSQALIRRKHEVVQMPGRMASLWRLDIIKWNIKLSQMSTEICCKAASCFV